MSIENSRVAVILLAAGRSARFGTEKLLHPLRDVPLAEHAARTLSAIPFGYRFVVLGRTQIDLSTYGFKPVQTDPDGPISNSLASGVSAASATGCAACLVALADMPNVPEQHFRALMIAHRGRITATESGGRKTVPALFQRTEFKRLSALQGDVGARQLLETAQSVPAAAHWMTDVDTPDDLRTL